MNFLIQHRKHSIDPFGEVTVYRRIVAVYPSPGNVVSDHRGTTYLVQRDGSIRRMPSFT